MASNKNFEYLGSTFQIQLLNQIIIDKDFSRSIIDVIETSYFENKYFKLIIQMIKEYYTKYEHTPTFDTLEQITKNLFVSIARPDPTRPSHQPGVACPFPAEPVT